MSTQQILGVVGFAVGWMFGYPQLGFVVGSLVGAALTPKQKSEGPRLDDLKVTVSTYGSGIPTIYGAGRVGGNVIFSTNKIEIPITTSSGGKGGGSENTTYVAFVHMAVALCYGEITGIRKMWKDGKLIYDVSLGGAVETAIATASSPYSRLTVYYGTEIQLPDAVQEIYLGAGNAPPYRGIAYVQMNAVECPGGHIPQFSFEVITSGTNGPEQLPTSAIPIPTPYNISQTYSRVPTDGSPVIIYNDGFRVEPGYAHNVHVYSVYALDVNYTSIIDTFAPGDYSANYLAIFGNADIDAVCLRYVLASTGVDQGYNTVFARDGTIKSFELTTAIKAYGQSPTSAWAKHGDNFAISGDSNQGFGLAIFSWESTFPVGLYPGVRADTVNCTTTHVWTTVDTLGVRSFSVRAIDDPSTPINAACPAAISSVSVYIYLTTSVNDTIYIIYETASQTVVLEATILGSVITVKTLETVPMLIDGPFAQLNGPVSFGNDLIAGVKKAPSGEWSASILALHRLTRVNEGVSDIISQQCLRAGLTAGQIDVSTITDTIHGYTIANPSSARNNIQPLMTAYAIDATEEDGKIKFFKRSAVASVATVPYVELGCAEGEGDAGDPMPLSVGQELELPRAVNVSYINPDFDYQTGTERAKRQVTLSRLDQNIEMPIGTNANHAASVAQMILYDAWNERSKRSAKVSRKYAFVSAGDGVTIEYPVGVNQLWRVTKVTDTGALCEWDVVSADESIYTQTALGSGIDSSQVAQVEPINSPTRATIVDSAMLRDVDNSAGPYVAMDGFSTFWTGAELFVGNTATNVNSQGTVSASAPTGFLESNLGNWTSNEVDETNVLSVNVGTDMLDTITRDQLLNGTGTVNVAAVGVAGRWEIIKFQRAVALGSGQYTITGLLRGRKGTEHARAFHKQGDLFVLMTTAGVLKPNMDVGSIGQALYYVAVSQGSAFESGTTQIYSATGEPLRPYSPVNPRRSAVGNDITLSWDRRTRLSDNAVSGSIPLGEAFEAYEVDVYSTPGFALLKATLDTNVSSVTITAAQQTAWELTPGAVITVRVYQMSDTVGRGRVLEISL